MKKCRVCNKLKNETDYYLCRRKGGNPNARHTECKECAKARIKATHASNPDTARNSHLLRNYGINLSDFNRMVLAQGAKCACCGTDKPGGKHNQWCVDHDHVTGSVRELLCKDCNIVLGLVEESPEHLQRLIAYIIKHKNNDQHLERIRSK